MTLKEPILVIGFNRPELTLGLFQLLRRYRPSEIYFAVDGPRSDHASDNLNVLRVQETLSAVDWPCEVHTRFLTENMGCGLAVSSAITWFFEHVERGIILEDDIRPSNDFFLFADEMLERYQGHASVASICGTNFVPRSEISSPEHSYRFSAITNVWGWATWSRAWKMYSYSMEDHRARLPLQKLYRAVGRSLSGVLYWRFIFRISKPPRIDTWDISWVVSQMQFGLLSVVPNINLIENVGFDEVATHTKRTPPFLRSVEAMNFPLQHAAVVQDVKADSWQWRMHIRSLASSFLRVVRRQK